MLLDGAESFPMINQEKHPVGWALLMYELEDAQNHLAQLIAGASGSTIWF